MVCHRCARSTERNIKFLNALQGDSKVEAESVSYVTVETGIPTVANNQRILE